MNLSIELEEYIQNKSSAEPEILQALRKETFQKMIQPHMISGFLQGRLLSTISFLTQPKYILDIGTFTGYSALCLSEGMQEEGVLVTIDKNPELQFLSEKYLNQTPKNIQFKEGNALEIIPTLPYSFDLVFLDADKDFYPEYIPLLLEKTHVGSIILADNTLWKGKVIDTSTNDKKTVALRRFNTAIVENSNFETVILPIRDGISIIRRK